MGLIGYTNIKVPDLRNPTPLYSRVFNVSVTGEKILITNTAAWDQTRAPAWQANTATSL